MKHGSLFSGIGGFDLAASWMQWENVFNCEKDVFCRRILQYYWPQTISYENVRDFCGTKYRNLIDVLSGGFPCQPFSSAGKRKGTADERYLWPQMLRIVHEMQPSWVVGENVSGLVNWEGGMVFRKVLANLESEGYEVWPYILPAGGVGAYHRRDRIFFIACRKDKFSKLLCDPAWKKKYFSDARVWEEFEGSPQSAESSHSDSIERRKGGMHKTGSKEAKRHVSPRNTWNAGHPWENFPSQSPLCGGNDGLPRELDRITFSAWRKESLKAYGNAIVPQVGFQIFQGIERVEASLLHL